MSHVLQLDLDDALQLIIKARERQTESRVWELYLVDRPNMTAETFVNYGDYYRRVIPPTNTGSISPQKTKDEILNDVAAIRSMAARR